MKNYYTDQDYSKKVEECVPEQLEMRHVRNIVGDWKVHEGIETQVDIGTCQSDMERLKDLEVYPKSVVDSMIDSLVDKMAGYRLKLSLIHI